MISRLLPLIGTGALLAGLALSVYWANRVFRTQPPPPQIELTEAVTASTKEERINARPSRPEVFYEVLTQRPLFTPDRRPLLVVAEPESKPVPPAVVHTPQPEKTPLPPLRLLGVMGSDTAHRALVQMESGETLWWTEGTQMFGWTVSQIGPNWLDLSSENEITRIEMYQQ